MYSKISWLKCIIQWVQQFLIKLNITLSCDLAIPLLDLPKRNENASTKTWILMSIATMRSAMWKNQNKLHTSFIELTELIEFAAVFDTTSIYKINFISIGEPWIEIFLKWYT